MNSHGIKYSKTVFLTNGRFLEQLAKLISFSSIKLKQIQVIDRKMQVIDKKVQVIHQKKKNNARFI